MATTARSGRLPEAGLEDSSWPYYSGLSGAKVIVQVSGSGCCTSEFGVVTSVLASRRFFQTGKTL
jgi:hypothetical protein